MDLGLQGKVALVAASSKGLGYGVAKALAANGARVSLCSRTEADVRRAAETLGKETGAETLATACDVRNPQDIQKWVDGTVAKWGHIDALLVNAGGPPAKLIKEMTDEDWQAAFELTLLSSVRMIRAALPHMSAGSAITWAQQEWEPTPPPPLSMTNAGSLASPISISAAPVSFPPADASIRP